MLVKIIRDIEGFENLKNEWEELEKSASDISFFSTFTFVKTWWEEYSKYYSRHGQLFIVCIYGNKKQLRGIGPFYINTRRLGPLKINILRFIGSGDYLNVIVANDDEKYETISKIISACLFSAEVDKISLDNIPQSSYLSGYLLKNPAFNDYFQYVVESPVIHLQENSSYEGFKKLHMNKLEKATERKLREISGFKFRLICPKDNPEIMDKISKIHVLEQEFLKKAKGRLDRRSLFEDSFRLGFLKKAVSVDSNYLIGFLEDDKGNIISYILTYLFRRVLYGYNTGYNPMYHKYKPGKILIYCLIEYLFNDRIADSHDMGVGRYPYKFGFTDKFNVNYKFSYWKTHTKRQKFFHFITRIGLFLKLLYPGK